MRVLSLNCRRVVTVGAALSLLFGTLPASADSHEDPPPPEIVHASLIQMIDTTLWVPPSSDPSGIVWNPSVDQLIVVDSEVNETGFFDDVNMWHINRSGAVLATGATWGLNSAGSYSDEPTGLGYDNITNTLYVSDDTGIRSVYVVQPGTDDEFGTVTDEVVSVNMSELGVVDAEDPEFDPVTGHLFVLGGTQQTVFRLDPVDGVFGNGNDIVTTIDISHLGPTDFEGMTSSAERRTLYVGARTTGEIFEITHDGQLVRTIIVDIEDNRFISGLAMAPSTADPSVMSLWIADRGLDEVLDSKIFEIAVPELDAPLDNLPPLVDAGPDQTVVHPTGVTLNGSVIDDGNPEDGVLTHTWSKQVGPGDVSFADAQAPTTTATFSQVGIYVLELSSFDGQFTSSDTLIVTVQAPANQPPTIESIDDVTLATDEVVAVDVVVSDADGDDLTITTDGLPPFASFDLATRQITIAPQAGDVGSYGPVTVTVSDAPVAGLQAPVFRSAASAAVTEASGSQLTINRPPGTEPGDLLIAQIRYRNSSTGVADLSVPDGWTEIGTIVDSSQSNHTVLYKFVGTGEAAQYTFDQNADVGRMAGGIGAYVGVAPGAPVHAWAASDPNIATLTAPGLETLIDETLIVRAWGWRDSQATDLGIGFNQPPAGVAERWSEQLGNSSTDRNRVLAGDHEQAIAGVVNPATASGSESVTENRRSALTIALAPAALGASVSTTFNITVTEGEPVNSPPVATDDLASTPMDTSVDVDVLVNDSDPDGDALTVVNVTDPAAGSVVVNADQSVTYAPSAGFTGVVSFTYQVSDGELLSNVATVTVTVTAPGGGDGGGGGPDTGPTEVAGIVVERPCVEDVSAAGFFDVSPASPHAVDIDCLVHVDVAQGIGNGLYDPLGDVTRWQMALFLVRTAAVLGLDVPETAPVFADLAGVPDAAKTAIGSLAAMGVTAGTSPTEFSPFAPVTRAQMALFLMRLHELTDADAPSSALHGFQDLAALNEETVQAINQIADLGVTVGTSPTTYSPNDVVTRQQMGSLLARLIRLIGVVE